MKVRIGSQVFQSGPGAGALKAREIEDQIAGNLASIAIKDAYDLSPRLLRGMRSRLQAGAMAEADRIFDVVTSIMDKPQGTPAGFVYTDLMRGVSLDPTIRAQGGRITWPDFSSRYYMFKKRNYSANRRRFFRLTNHLQSYFSRQGSSIVRNRLGGIQVSVDTSPAHGAQVRRYAGNTVWRRAILPEEVSKLLLGRVEVTMFPRLSPALAPMLSTRRWTDAGRGGMERQMFAGTRTMHKLINGNRPYRPLVSPVVQFFMLVRIPNAIRRALNNYLSRTALR